MPITVPQAVDTLRTACPELERVWQSLTSWMGDTDANAVGIYNVVGQLVLPSIAYLLGDPDLEDLKQRDDDYRDVPDRNTAAAEDFLRRLYAAIDAWAASPYTPIGDAVWIEFVESGYSNLSVEDLVRYAGPVLRRMADAEHGKRRRWLRKR